MPNTLLPEKRWTRQQADPTKVEALQQELKIAPVLCELLVQRGIETFEQAKHFFRPSIDDLHDPFLMEGMAAAVERIEKAIANKENILVYGDYDVDGTTAVSLMYSFIHDFYPNVDYYIPDRYKEGYGVSLQGIDFAAENGYSLIIALDCGIKAIDQVNYAKERGVDFVICDHHNPGDVIPDAVAVLDPKRKDCNYPYKELCGCGVGFKLAQAFAEHNDMPFETVAKYLDLVAVSIAADIVPITGENRVLAFFGLQQVNNEPSLGLRSLIASAGKKGELSITDLVFIVGPRINAAGRMGSARDAVKLLIEPDSLGADGHADTLNDRNAARKEEDKNITEEALQMIREDAVLVEAKTTVLFQQHWHKGVIGIVASRLTEHFYRPTIVFTESNGKLTGSARSVRGYDVYEALSACDDLIEQWGGHKYAAGLTILPEQFDAFRARFEQVVSDTIDPHLLVPEVTINAELDLKDITPSFYKILKQFGPFGPQNMRPVFVAKGVKDAGYSRIVGETHLKMHITQDGKCKMNGIAFGLGNMYQYIKNNGPVDSPEFDICYCVNINEWQGRQNLEVEVKDIKLRP